MDALRTCFGRRVYTLSLVASKKVNKGRSTLALCAHLTFPFFNVIMHMQFAFFVFCYGVHESLTTTAHENHVKVARFHHQQQTQQSHTRNCFALMSHLITSIKRLCANFKANNEKKASKIARDIFRLLCSSKKTHSPSKAAFSCHSSFKTENVEANEILHGA